MLTHVHEVIRKVVSTFARVLRGREKWRLKALVWFWIIDET
jgi:hypothetical protein